MMRSGPCSREAALVQSVRCTLTPPPRVTKPMMLSPGTGVQHLASGWSAHLDAPGPPPRVVGAALPHRHGRRRGPLSQFVFGASSAAADLGGPAAARDGGRDVTLADRGVERDTSGSAAPGPARPSPRRSSSAATEVRRGGPPCAMASLPLSSASSRRSLANHCRILAFARGDTTKPASPRRAGVGALEVNTSTTSPFSSLRSSATRRPLTLAPIQRWPTSVCTA